MAASYDVAKVEYTSPSLLEDVYASVKETVDEVFKKAFIGDDNDDRRKAALERFDKCFRETMAANLVLVNEDQATDETNKTDPRLVHYCTDVLPKAVTMQTTVMKKRKTYPRKCRKRLQTKLVKEAAEYETEASNVGNDEKQIVMEEETDGMDEELLGLATTVATNLSAAKQIMTRVQTKAKALQMAKTINSDIEKLFDTD